MADDNRTVAASWDAWCEKTAAELTQDELAATLGRLAFTDDRLLETLYHALEQLRALERMESEARVAGYLSDEDSIDAAGAGAMLAVLRASRVVLEVCGAEQRRRATEGGAA